MVFLFETRHPIEKIIDDTFRLFFLHIEIFKIQASLDRSFVLPEYRSTSHILALLYLLVPPCQHQTRCNA